MFKCISRILLLVIFGIVFGIGILVSDDDAVAASGTATVKGSIVNVRAGPGLDYSKITTVKKGSRFEIVDQQNGWYKLNIWKGITGWVIGDYLVVNKPVVTDRGTVGPVVTNKYGLVTGQTVNIRSGPGTNYPVVTKAQKGQQFTVVGEGSGWYKLSLSGGKTGWIIKDYFSLKPSSAGTGPSTGNTSVGNPPAAGNPPLINSPGSKYVVIKESIVNVRSGAGTNYPVVAKVKASERYIVIQQKGDWYLINLGQKQGWIAGWLVDLRSGALPSRDDTGSKPPVPDSGTSTPPEEAPGTGQTGGTDEEGTDTNGGSDQKPDDGATAAKLTDVRFETGSDGEENIIINADTPLEYKLSTMTNPSRIVIDIKNCSVNGFSDFFINGELASQVRVAQYSLSPMAVRIVVDLNRMVDYAPSLSKDGKKLTISLSEPTIEGKIIVIDAGHGDYDPGAIGVTGLQEKDFNLETALLLRDKLTDLGATVVLTRDDDEFVSLTERSRIANDAKADVFVAIHANSSTSSSLRGTSTYYYAPSSNSKLYAQAEQRKRLAGSVQEQLVDEIGTRNIGILQENFAVLRGTNMPSILVESAFLSNPDDEALLKDSSFREKVAQSIADGLLKYFGVED